MFVFYYRFSLSALIEKRRFRWLASSPAKKKKKNKSRFFFEQPRRSHLWLSGTAVGAAHP